MKVLKTNESNNLETPWATLVAEGLKKFKFRNGNYKYRGNILIHAGMGTDKEAMKKLENLKLIFSSIDFLIS